MRRLLILNHNEEGFGTYWRCFYLAKHLAEHFDVTLMCFTKSVSKRWKTAVKDRVKILYAGKYSDNRILTTAFRSLLSFASRFDVVHAFAVVKLCTGLPAIAAKFSRKMLVVDWDDWWTRGGLIRKRSLLHETLEEGIPRIADAVTVVSEALRRRGLSLDIPHSKVFKVENGADIELIKPIPHEKARFTLGFPQNNKYLLHMGGTRSKEFLTVLKALRIVIKKERRTKLVIVGGQPDLNVQRFIKEASLEPYIIFVGRVLHDVVPLYLGLADVLLLPMDDNPWEASRFPIRLGDFLAAGRIIIAGSVGEVGKIVGGCGLIVKPGDEVEWAEKITVALSDKEMTEHYGELARQVAEKLSWKNIAKKVYNIYTNIIQFKGTEV